MAKKSKPAAQFRNGNLKSCIWENKVKIDGQNVTQNRISIQKSYQDTKTGEWVNFELSLFPAEVARLISVLQAAYEGCALRRIV